MKLIVENINLDELSGEYRVRHLTADVPCFVQF